MRGVWGMRWVFIRRIATAKLKGLFIMAKFVPITVEFVTTREGMLFDRTTKVNNVPADGGTEAATELLLEAFNSNVPEAHGQGRSTYNATISVNGVQVGERGGLNKLQFRHIEDEIVDTFKGFRKLKGK